MNVKLLNEMVLIEPIEKKNNSIIILKDESTHRRGVVVAVCEDEDFLAVGDTVVYSDSSKEVTFDNKKYHMIKRAGIFFKEV